AAEAAARAARAESGEQEVIGAASPRASPARRGARRLLASGPAVGACWGAALIINRAWAWPIPAGVRVLLGTALITAIALLAAAAFSGSYRPAGRAATAGCLGITALDLTLLTAIPLASPAVMWPVIAAAGPRVGRITFTPRHPRPVPPGPPGPF